MTDHEALMRRAMHMASTARLRARPNPWVGAILLTTDGSLHDGATMPPGGPHAEIEAITAARAAGADTDGATLVCTLEPCSHVGRTGPCTEAIIDAGISRVVIGVEDPDPRVAGTGVARLRAAGVDVEVGILAEEVSVQLAPYLHHRRTGRPFVVAKMACTLDGRTTAPGGARWITGDEARRAVHELRAESDAIVVGAATVRADDPELTVRHVDGPSPRRIVMTSTPLPRSAKVHPCTEWSGTPESLLESLGGDGALQVLLEGGPTLAAAFHRAGLIDRWVLHVAPVVHGEHDAPGLFADDPVGTGNGLTGCEIVSHRVLGEDVEIVMEPTREGTVTR